MPKAVCIKEPSKLIFKAICIKQSDSLYEHYLPAVVWSFMKIYKCTRTQTGKPGYWISNDGRLSNMFYLSREDFDRHFLRIDEKDV